MNAADAREKLGICRKEMAELMGVHYETLAKWERAQRQPDKAAVQLMRWLCWLHGKHPRVFTNGRKEI
jgi:DNA-binding transcriptional regulator YiaG